MLIACYVVFQLRNEVNIDRSTVNTIKIRESDFPATATCTLSGWETAALVRSAVL
jgi:hypothetical protein